MDEKFEIVWRNPEKTVLMINYFQNGTWEDILEANSMSDVIVREVQHNVIVFHNGGDYSVDMTDIGSIKGLFYNKAPSIPKNLILVIILLKNWKGAMSLKIGMETLDKVIFRRKLNYFVHSMEEAEELIKQAGL